MERDRPHIIDVRDLESFEPIPFADTKDKFIVRAEAFEAITNPNYFIEKFEAALFQQGVV